VRRFLIILLALPLTMSAADWTYFESGPFQVYSAAGNQAGRQALNELEQLRNALRQTLGGEDLDTVWPVRLLVFDSASSASGYPLGSFRLLRDAWIGAIVRGSEVPMADCVRILLDANTRRMPPSVERGLLSLFSTLRVNGTVVELGDPVPEPQRDQEWAMMHLITVTPQYGGRSSAFFSNLQQGADWQAAYWNAFSKTPEAMEQEAAAYLAAGRFESRRVSGAAIDPERQFRPGATDDEEMSFVLADALEADPAQQAYSDALARYPESAEALEGLGRYAEAVAAGSTSAHAYLEYGRSLGDPNQAADQFRKAAALNPRWGEPHYQLALLESNPAQKSRLLREATELAPRNVDYWIALAETYISTDSFREAGRAWAGAEGAAEDEQERAGLNALRRQVEQQRADYIAEQERLEREKQEAAIARVREQAMERIREAERAINADDPEREEGQPLLQWWDDPREQRSVTGALEQVDCLRGGATLQMSDGAGGQVMLRVSILSRLVILGDGQTLACGAQEPAREVLVRYLASDREQPGVSGEAVSVEFR